MRHYPALDLHWPAPPDDETVGLVLAAVDDEQPTAVEPQPGGVRIFFGDEQARDRAAVIVGNAFPDVALSSSLIPDDNWAERSQAGLTPVRVGRLIVTPPWAKEAAAADVGPDDIVLTIQPSMGFGTGHHQSTRLCLELLQRHVRAGVSVLDIGTGSGVLAAAAVRLGAGRALAVDYDTDALESARENIDANGLADRVTLQVFDLAAGRLPESAPFDVVCANITAGVLERHAALVAATVAPGGLLVTSGYQEWDAADVAAAFSSEGLRPIDEALEDDWIAHAFTR